MDDIGFEQKNGGVTRCVKATAECLGLRNPVVQVAVVKRVLLLVRRGQINRLEWLQVMVLRQLGALVN